MALTREKKRTGIGMEMPCNEVRPPRGYGQVIVVQGCNTEVGPIVWRDGTESVEPLQPEVLLQKLDACETPVLDIFQIAEPWDRIQHDGIDAQHDSKPLRLGDTSAEPHR